MTMSNENGGQPHETLDAYLDGQLNGAALAAFERAMAADPLLRKAVDHQRAIDASLGRLFGEVAPVETEGTQEVTADELRPAAAAAVAEAAPPPPQGPHPIEYRQPTTRGPIRIPWPLAAAAILLFTVGMSWTVWQYIQEPAPLPAFVQKISLDQQYRAEESRGFKASWKCKDEQEFMATFVKQFGAPLTMDEPTGDSVCLGLSYNAVMSPQTTYLLAKVNNQDVMVFIDRIGCSGAIAQQELKQPGDLHVFSKQVGDFALYEVTPLEKAHLLDLFRIPAADVKPTAETTTN